MITLTLPWPPSVNSIWRAFAQKGKVRTILSKTGRQYRKDAGVSVGEQHMGLPLEGRLAVSVTLCPPDKRRRDIDNHVKGLLDALTHACVWVDDEQIDRLTILRGDNTKGGAAVVQIEELA